MKNLICLSVLAFLAMPAVHAKPSMEVRVPLSKSGYDKIRAIFKRTEIKAAKEKVRHDYYFEIYDGSHFVLERAKLPMKLRIKDNRKKSVVQLAIKTSSQSFVCADTALETSFKESHQFKLGRQGFKHVKSLTMSVLSQLNYGPSAYIPFFLIRMRELLFSTHTKKERALRNILKPFIPAGRSYLVPTHHAFKRSYTATLASERGPVGLSLRKTSDFDHRENVIISYELEAEPVNFSAWTPASLSEFICLSLGLDQLGSTDIDNTRKLRKPLTLKQLQAVNPTLFN